MASFSEKAAWGSVFLVGARALQTLFLGAVMANTFKSGEHSA
jgi:hypothetical protein